MEWRGIAYITLWYLSITSGFLAVCCPTIPLMFVCPHTFRNIMGIIFSVWEMYPTVSKFNVFGMIYFNYINSFLDFDASVFWHSFYNNW